MIHPNNLGFCILNPSIILRIFILICSCALISGSPLLSTQNISIPGTTSNGILAPFGTSSPISFTVNDGNILGLAISSDDSKLAISAQPASTAERGNDQMLQGKIDVFSIDNPHGNFSQITPDLPIYLLLYQYPYGKRDLVLGCWESGGIAISNNNYVAAVSSDGTMQLWSISANKRIAWDGGTYNGNMIDLENAYYHSNSNYRTYFSVDDSILGISYRGKLYRTLDGKQLTQGGESQYFNYYVDRSTNGNYWGPYGEFRTIDWREWNFIPLPGIVWPLAISPSGKYVLDYRGEAVSPTLSVWTASSSSSILNIPISPTLKGLLLKDNDFVASFSRDDNQVVILSVYGVYSGRSMFDEGYISPDNKYLGDVSIWDISAKKKISEETFPMFYPRATVFSRNGDMIAYVATPNTVEVRKLEMN